MEAIFLYVTNKFYLQYGADHIWPLLFSYARFCGQTEAAASSDPMKPTARAKSEQVVELIGQGMTKKDVAEEVGIGVASVYRILKN